MKELEILYLKEKIKELENELPILCDSDYYNQCVRKSDEDIGEKYESILTLNNVLPFPIDKTVTVDLEFMPDYPAQYCEPFGYESINSFKIYDADGNEIAYKVVDIQRGKRHRE